MDALKLFGDPLSSKLLSGVSLRLPGVEPKSPMEIKLPPGGETGEVKLSFSFDDASGDTRLFSMLNGEMRVSSTFGLLAGGEVTS